MLALSQNFDLRLSCCCYLLSMRHISFRRQGFGGNVQGLLVGGLGGGESHLQEHMNGTVFQRVAVETLHSLATSEDIVQTAG